MALPGANQSVRPPAADRPGRAPDVDPLEGWDLDPDHPDDESHDQQQWAVAAGAMAAGLLAGAATGAGVAGRLRRGILGALVGALGAIVGMRSWTRPPEDDAWALRLQDS